MTCSQNEKSGLILHSGAIGDCLLTLPLAESVKEVFALDRMDFIGSAEYIDFYPGRTCIDSIRSIDSIPLYRLFEGNLPETLTDTDYLLQAFADYEQVISFLGEGNDHFEKNLIYVVHSSRSAEVTVLPAKPPLFYEDHITTFHHDRFIEYQPVTTLPDSARISVTPMPDDYLAGQELLEQAGIDTDQRVVIIHPGSGAFNKCWHWNNFILTAAELQENDVQVVFLLGPAEQARFSQQAIDAMERFCVMENLSLTQVLQCLTQADAFLGNDSGIGHLAAAMGKKTLIIFGPSNPVQYTPCGPHVFVEKIPQGVLTVPDTPQQKKMAARLFELL